MKTNDIKKGDRILLDCGWYATMADNKKGDIRLAKVEGTFTELGSIYSHDIISFIDRNGNSIEIEHTPKQLKLKEQTEIFFS